MRISESCAKCLYDRQKNKTDNEAYLSEIRELLDNRKETDTSPIKVTHDHYDHFSPEDVRKVAKSGSVLVVPEKMAAKAQEVSGSVGRIETVKPAVYREISGLEFETVPAYNTLKPFHPEDPYRWNSSSVVHVLERREYTGYLKQM